MFKRLIRRIGSTLGLLAWAACLAACARATSPDISPSPLPVVSTTPSPLYLATTASTSPLPSQTTTPFLSPTSRPSPSHTATPFPTIDLVGTIQSASVPSVRSSHVSPDGFWWARVFSYDCTLVNEGIYAFDTLEIHDQRRGGEQVIYTQLIACGGLGAAGLQGMYWSPTSRFFYFTDAASGVPDGCGYWQTPLMRVDLTDWSVTAMGAGPVSPDGYKLATWQAGELAIWYVSGAQLSSAPPPVTGMLPGPIAWSPDSQSVAYLLSQSACPLGLTYLIRMDLDDFQPVPYLASQDPSFAAISWDTPNRVTLTDEAGNLWSYNFISGSLDHFTP